jgi:hypothetical protein
MDQRCRHSATLATIPPINLAASLCPSYYPTVNLSVHSFHSLKNQENYY